MKNYKITCDINKEFKAKDEFEAMQLFIEELATENKSITNYLVVEEIKTKKRTKNLFEVVDTELITENISKDFIIELPNGDNITINKHQYNTEQEHDQDWDFVDSNDKKLHNKMTQELQDMFYDFVQDLSLTN